jgi:hypothetical protein
MNIIVNEINNNINKSYFKNLPLKNQRRSSLKPFKQPKVIQSRKQTAGPSASLRNYKMKEFTRHDMKQDKIMQTTMPVMHNGNIGKHELKLKIDKFKLLGWKFYQGCI